MKNRAQTLSKKYYFLSEANTLLNGSLADFLIWCRQRMIRIYQIKPHGSEITRALVESSAILRFAHESNIFLRYTYLPKTQQRNVSSLALKEQLLPEGSRNESEIPIAPDPHWYESLIQICRQHTLSCATVLRVSHYKPLTRIHDRNQIIINGHAAVLRHSLAGQMYDTDPFRMIGLDRHVPENGFLVVWMEDRQFWYIIHGYLVAGQTGIMLPTLANTQSRWQRFQNAWDLLKQPPEIINKQPVKRRDL